MIVSQMLRRKKIGDTGLADTALLAASAQSKANVPTMGGLLICGADDLRLDVSGPEVVMPASAVAGDRLARAGRSPRDGDFQ